MGPQNTILEKQGAMHASTIDGKLYSCVSHPLCMLAYPALTVYTTPK